MKRKRSFLITLFLLISLKSFTQNEEMKWIFSVGSGSALYSQSDVSSIGGKYIAQFPRLSLGLYVFKNVTFVGGISSALDNTKKYTTFDGAARYDFGTSTNTISPYVFIGGSFISAKNLTPTVNIGAGGTIWISDRFGLTGELMRKLSENRFTSQKSHTFGSAGIVYLFSLSGSSSSSNKIIRDSRKSRIWEKTN